jgi:formylglycine-generating enzyme required for sulfatase activity
LQYRRFMQANGYNRREFWSDDGWAWRTGTYDNKVPKEHRDRLSRRPVNKRHEPYFWHDLKWNNPLAPVVGVSWFEAKAYCNWLAQELKRRVRLPTNGEWARAAREAYGCKYPWGNEFDRRRLNCAAWWQDDDYVSFFDDRIASTTIVGQFAEGNSPAGVSDLGGNVWEWTSWGCSKARRLVRGGAWNDEFLNLHTTSDANFPDFADTGIGFRVVSPGSSSGS